MIHPQAHVSPEARIGTEVRIGPGAVIDAGSVIGDRCEIRAHAIITGGTVLGTDNQIGYGAVIGAEPQDISFNGGNSRVEMGSHNIIREYATIHRGTKPDTVTKIGDRNFLMAGCHVAHNCQIGNGVILVNNVLLAGYVTVEDRAFLGGAAVVHQFVRIGEMAIMRGQTRIGKDLPPYFMAVDTNQVAGLNRVALRRNGVGGEARRQLQQAFEILYRSGLNIGQALEKIDAELGAEEVKKLTAFIRGTKRGICRGYLKASCAAEGEDE